MRGTDRAVRLPEINPADDLSGPEDTRTPLTTNLATSCDAFAVSCACVTSAGGRRSVTPGGSCDSFAFTGCGILERWGLGRWRRFFLTWRWIGRFRLRLRIRRFVRFCFCTGGCCVGVGVDGGLGSGGGASTVAGGFDSGGGGAGVGHLVGPRWLVACLLYGAGLRLLECCRLREWIWTLSSHVWWCGGRIANGSEGVASRDGS